jgi:salicylate hydroxylase
MDGIRSRQIIIAGAGIAGLTAALAFAARGFSVQVFERSLELTEVGAGLQLSPNATRILGRLGVMRALGRSAVRPSAVLLRDAATLSELARIPLGDAAETRWKAPYLVVHRADLQKALLKTVERESEIRLTLGATVRDIAIHLQGVTASIDLGSTIRDARGLLLVGADGVWSSLRSLAGASGRSRFSRQIAWRRTIRSDLPGAAALFSETTVTAFLHPGFHMVAYPVRGGSAINLAAFTKGGSTGEGWSGSAQIEQLMTAMRGTAPALLDLARTGDDWTTWPIHTIRPGQPYIAGGSMALIGDAAHAMTPFAAQGAAMAIEDAETLAACVADHADDLASALGRWEARRRARIGKARSRGTLNRFAWHASGPVALVRNEVLRRRGPAKLMADLDWLYGYDAATDGKVS